MIIKDDRRIICPECHCVVIKLVHLYDDGTGLEVCRKCKKKILLEESKMVLTKNLKISEMSLDRLRAYAENYKLCAPVNSNEEEERMFYIKQLQELNEHSDDLMSKVDAGKYKGINSCVCSVCGETRSVRAEVYARRVEKCGSEEKLKASYKCRECRKK